MRKIDNSISLEEAAARRGVSKRRITQQVTEGGWGIRKIARGRYLLYEDENFLNKFYDQYNSNRIISEGEDLKFKDEDRPLNDQEIEWLLNDACYEVGSIRPNDLKAMGNSLKKTYKALKNFGDLNQLELEDSAWGVMAVETIIEVFEEREARKSKSVSSGYLSPSS